MTDDKLRAALEAMTWQELVDFAWRNALAASATDEGPRDTPEQTHSAEYNRGWAEGNASALDACNPVIERLQTELRARPAVPALDVRCAAIWNGCRCDRRPHDGDGHVWRNTLDGEVVDPALYPRDAVPARASATDEEPDFCPDCGNVPGSQRWNRVHRPAVPALDERAVAAHLSEHGCECKRLDMSDAQAALHSEEPTDAP